ncbi:MAG: AAA family ATPase [Lentisphaeria bacterium]
MIPTLTIIRGLPGSGKSVLAKRLAAKTGCLFIEPDMFMVKNGQYCYTPKHYYDAEIIATSCIFKAAETNADAIFADVLPKIADVNRVKNLYWSGACYHDYKLVVIDMPLITVEQSIERNVHNVKREDIRKMAADWEPWTE